jgi:hypothetical protein
MASEDAQKDSSGPISIGYKTFADAEECRGYFRHILTGYRRNQDLNEYEVHNVMQLIEKGHPHAEKKLEGGIRAIQIREKRVDGRSSKCFHLLKENGTIEDVSYVKCVEALFGSSGEKKTS